MDDRLVHVDHAMPALLVIAELVVAEIVIAGIADRLIRRTFTHFQCGQCHERFERGARRIGAVDRPVDHRFVRVLVELLPVVGRDAIDEQVGVVSWCRNEGQNAAGLRVDGDQRTFAVAKGLFGDLLQLGVQRQRQIVAGHRWNPLQAT